MYEAGKTHAIHEYKAAVKAEWLKSGGSKLQGPIMATLTFVFARPKKVPKKAGPLRLWKATKPDCDNLIKGVFDSLNKLAYDDDGMICECVCRKYFAGESEVPGVHVTLTEF
jgi:Holliday junction resolvase RusA-like endonuclease